MPVLRNCCCFFGLRRGTITLGFLGLTGALTSIITLALGLVFVEDVAHAVVQILTSAIDPTAALGNKHKTADEQQSDLDNLEKYLINGYSKFVFILAIVAMLIAALFSGFMIYGAVKGRRFFLIPWLVLGIIDIILVLLLTVLIMIYVSFGSGIAVLIFCLIEIVIMLYFWVVVFSFYQELRDRDRMEFNVPVEMKTRLTSNM